MSQLCLTHTAFYLFLKHARSFLTEGFLKDGVKRLHWLWQPCRLKGYRGEGKRWGGAEENETDTFISVDSQLNRVAINCSVHEFGRLKGGGIHFFPPRQHLSLNTCRPPHPPHKYQIKSDSDVQFPAKWMSLIVSHQNRCNLGLDAFH